MCGVRSTVTASGKRVVERGAELACDPAVCAEKWMKNGGRHCKKGRSNSEPRPGAGTVLEAIEDVSSVAGQDKLAEFESVGCYRPLAWLVCC